MVRLLQKSENPMSWQDLGVLGGEVGWGWGAGGMFQHCLWLLGRQCVVSCVFGGDLNLGSNGGEAQEGVEKGAEKAAFGVS